MAFRFPLAGLLQFREKQERQQEILLQQANHAAAELRRAIEDLDRAQAQMAAHAAAELQSGMPAAELQFGALRRTALRERRQKLHEEWLRAEELCAAQRQALQHARRQREAVETLRRHQLELYQENEKRQEQRSMDDLFLMRREFLRRS